MFQALPIFIFIILFLLNFNSKLQTLKTAKNNKHIMSKTAKLHNNIPYKAAQWKIAWNIDFSCLWISWIFKTLETMNLFNVKWIKYMDIVKKFAWRWFECTKMHFYWFLISFGREIQNLQIFMLNTSYLLMLNC